MPYTMHKSLVGYLENLDNNHTSENHNPFVRKLEALVSFTDEEKEMLHRISGASRFVGPRTDLIREEDKLDGALLIMKGVACRYRQRLNGQRQITSLLLPGDLSDLDVKLLKRASHTVSTISTCQVVYLSLETISDIQTGYPAIARALQRDSLVRESTLNEWLTNLGGRQAVERLAHLMCEVLFRLRSVSLCHDNSYCMPLTQLNIGQIIGLSNVHVNRSLQELRRQGLIKLTERRLTVLNLPGLIAIADFDPSYLSLERRGVRSL